MVLGSEALGIFKPGDVSNDGELIQELVLYNELFLLLFPRPHGLNYKIPSHTLKFGHALLTLTGTVKVTRSISTNTACGLLQLKYLFPLTIPSLSPTGCNIMDRYLASEQGILVSPINASS